MSLQMVLQCQNIPSRIKHNIIKQEYFFKNRQMNTVLLCNIGPPIRQLILDNLLTYDVRGNVVLQGKRYVGNQRIT